jgi:hypothetical protein
VGRPSPLPQPLAVGSNRPPRRAKFTHSKFKRATLILAIFTGLLAVATWMQVLAFIRSEQAYLVLVGDPYFFLGTPSAESGGFNFGLTIKNIGKHVAVITELNITPYSYVHQKLPDTPKYLPQPATPVTPPIYQMQKQQL